MVGNLMEETGNNHQYILISCCLEACAEGGQRMWVTSLEECRGEGILLALWVVMGVGGGVNRCSVDGLAIRGITNGRHIEADIMNTNFQSCSTR